jgi:hypothetical protein
MRLSNKKIRIVIYDKILAHICAYSWIPVNATGGSAAQFCNVDNASTKKAVWNHTISNVTSNNNGCDFEFLVVTDYLMTNFCYQLRSDIDDIEPLSVTEHHNFIEKKGLTEISITCKQPRSVRTWYITGSNLHDCMKPI